jgi:hypothetical protein
MPAKMRINSEETLVELETPEGDVLGPLDIYDEEEDAEPIFIVDEDNPNAPAYVAIVAEYEGLKARTVYQLVEVVTEVETGVDLEGEDEDEDDEDEEDGGVLVQE